MAKQPAKSIDYNGKVVPLTKDGLPSLVHLPKAMRPLVKKYGEQKKKDKEQILEKELEELLKKLSSK
jgi:hypothetical protein